MLACIDDGTLSYRLRRMMPTVGCEADAVAFTEQAEALWSRLPDSAAGRE